MGGNLSVGRIICCQSVLAFTIIEALSAWINRPHLLEHIQFAGSERASIMAVKVGLEPTTKKLTASCSTTELLDIWRRHQDSNLGDSCLSGSFQDYCNKPLCHVSLACLGGFEPPTNRVEA